MGHFKTIYTDTFDLERLRAENEALRDEVEFLKEIVAHYVTPDLLAALAQPVSDGSEGVLQ